MRIQTTCHDYIFVNKQKVHTSEASCRRVFFYNDLAIKIEDNNYGDGILGQCITEYEVWQKLEDNDRKYFAPILGHRFTKNRQYVIQPKLEFGNYSGIYKKKIYKDIIEPLAKKYELYDIVINANWDIQKNGEPIIFDYGV
jgi:hypothetical protein